MTTRKSVCSGSFRTVRRRSTRSRSSVRPGGSSVPSSPPNRSPRPPSIPPNRSRIDSRRPTIESIISGSSSSRRVWPVGAVSTTTRSNRGSSRYSISCRIAAASSAPGIDPPISGSNGLPASPPAASPTCPRPPRGWSPNTSAIDASGSISAPNSGAPSRTRSGSGPIGVSSVSDSECAGSVETTSVGVPASALASAVAAAQVVLPTPPFPPYSTYVGASTVAGAAASTVTASASSTDSTGSTSRSFTPPGRPRADEYPSIVESAQPRCARSRAPASSTRAVVSENRTRPSAPAPNASPGIPATPASSISRSTDARSPATPGRSART
ncbi:MAG: hypothetical protein A07HB70_00110 [uncultured archaeon A07HB70]|nr:MAG: hypothetical protein A07HB70_00110 [uncultured archaeon A07HB70]